MHESSHVLGWVVAEIGIFTVFVILGFLYVSHRLPAIEMSMPVEGNPISREELEVLLNSSSFNLTEQIHIVLLFLGERVGDVDLRDMYDAMVGRDDITLEYYDLSLACEVMLLADNRNFNFIRREVAKSMTDGTFIGVLETVEELIQSSVPNYVMRFD